MQSSNSEQTEFILFLSPEPNNNYLQITMEKKHSINSVLAIIKQVYIEYFND